MSLATYESDNFIATDCGDYIALCSKWGVVPIAFEDWDAVMDAVSVLVRGLSPDMRHRFLLDAFSARELEEAFDARNAEAL